jgi:3-isopropylmalate/(R)-2-methylmalate dehydratase large subunit
MTERRPDHIKFSGRILFLTEDTALIRQQLEATGDEAAALETELASRLSAGVLPLMSNISTDEITPGWVCFYYDETLGQYVYVGMREGAVKKDEVKNGGFRCCRLGTFKRLRLLARDGAVRREGRGCATRHRARVSRRSTVRIRRNIGLLTSTDFSLIDRIRRGEEIPLTEFTKGIDPISQDIVTHGGLFNYNKARLSGKVSPPPLETPPRPMTIVEKIIARHAFVTAGTDRRRSSETGRRAVCTRRCALLA